MYASIAVLMTAANMPDGGWNRTRVIRFVVINVVGTSGTRVAFQFLHVATLVCHQKATPVPACVDMLAGTWTCMSCTVFSRMPSLAGAVITWIT